MTTDLLLASIEDTVALSVEVEQRFVSVTDTMVQRGKLVQFSKEMQKDLERWREMVVRFKRGDFRNTRTELLALRNIAQWTVDTNCELRNQPKKKLTWVD